MKSLTLFLLLFLTTAAWAQTDPFLDLGDGLYRYSAGTHHSMVWVTEDGVLVVDPLSREAATRLKAEIAGRFDQPLRYVVYSHNHFDHSYGGEVLREPGVTFVSHELARRDMVDTRADTELPDLTFRDELKIYLGGETLHLRYHDSNNGLGNVSFLWVERKLLFVVDWIVVGRMPYKDLPGYDINGMIRSTEEALAFDWDRFVGGHAEIGGRNEVRRYLRYLVALRDQVLDGMIAGKELSTLKEEIKLEEFSDFVNFQDWLPLNIEGVYRHLADRSYVLSRPR